MDGKVDLTEEEHEADFTLPVMKTGDGNVNFTDSEDKVATFRASCFATSDGDVDFIEAEFEETFTAPGLVIDGGSMKSS